MVGRVAIAQLCGAVGARWADTRRGRSGHAGASVLAARSVSEESWTRSRECLIDAGKHGKQRGAW